MNAAAIKEKHAENKEYATNFKNVLMEASMKNAQPY
jgi:hypothetical protein